MERPLRGKMLSENSACHELLNTLFLCYNTHCNITDITTNRNVFSPLFIHMCTKNSQGGIVSITDLQIFLEGA